MAYTAGKLRAASSTSGFTNSILQIQNDFFQAAKVANTGDVIVYARPSDAGGGLPFLVRNETDNTITVEGRFAETPEDTWRAFTINAQDTSIMRVIELRMNSSYAAFTTGIKVGW